MANAILVVASLLAFLLDLPVALWAVRARSIPVFCLAFWLVLLNANSTIDCVAWYDSVQDSRGWCIISSRIKFGGLLAIPTAVLCLARLLTRTFSRDLASQLSPADRKGNVLNCLACFVAPLVAIGTHFLFSPALYAISPGTGCEPTFFLSLPTYLLFFVWQESLSLANLFIVLYLAYRYYRIKQAGVMRDYVKFSPSTGTWLTEALLWRWLALVVLAGVLNFVATLYSVSTLSARADQNGIDVEQSRIWTYDRPAQGMLQYLFPIQGLFLGGLSLPESWSIIKSLCNTSSGFRNGRRVGTGRDTWTRQHSKCEDTFKKTDSWHADKSLPSTPLHPVSMKGAMQLAASNGNRSRSNSTESAEVLLPPYRQPSRPVTATSADLECDRAPSIYLKWPSRASRGQTDRRDRVSRAASRVASQQYSQSQRESTYTLSAYASNTNSQDNSLTTSGGSGTGYFVGTAPSSKSALTAPSVLFSASTPPSHQMLPKAASSKKVSTIIDAQSTSLSSLRPGTFYETETAVSTRLASHAMFNPHRGNAPSTVQEEDETETLSLVVPRGKLLSRVSSTASSKSRSTSSSKSRSLISRALGRRTTPPKVAPWKRRIGPGSTTIAPSEASEGSRGARRSVMNRNFGPLATAAW